VHVTGFDPVHVPAWHVFVWLHRFDPVHVVPFGAFVTVQLDVPLQLRVAHVSLVHVMAVPPHEPLVQTSLYVH
jgi:hypothetical protein